MTLEDRHLDEAGLPLRPSIDGSDIARLRVEDVPEVSRALARAFEDDPIMTWVFRPDEQRLARLERAFDLYLRTIWLPEDECWAVAGNTGAALWMPPGKWHLSIWQELRLLPRMLAVNGRNLPRLLAVLQLIEKKHPKGADHYYLAVLGVEPEIQGRGFGSALLQPVLARCDRDRTPAYLESSKRRNVVLYERHGFRVVEELRLPRGGPPIWRMWRDPA